VTIGDGDGDVGRSSDVGVGNGRDVATETLVIGDDV
jgi:hypothetical protein